MKILTFFQNIDIPNYTNNLLLKTIQERGHEITNLQSSSLLTIPFPFNGTLIYDREIIDLSNFNAVAMLGRGKVSRYLYDMLKPHIPTFINPYSKAIMDDKISTSILLSNNGINVVDSLFSTGEIDRASCLSLSEFVVEKPVDGKRGIGVVLHKEDIPPIEGKIAQRYIDCNGSDERWLIVNGKIVCAETRHSRNPKKEFRSSLSAGGYATPLEATEEMQELAKRVYDCFPDCLWTGIDIIRDKDGTVYVGECNANPQHGIISVTGHNFYEDVVNYIEENA